jgi:hypothetical protein
LVNEFEQARILAMHTPPALMRDPELQAFADADDLETLATRYWGYAEFAVDPLTGPARVVYGHFLGAMRARAIWIEGWGPRRCPAIWIAVLEPPIAPR